LPGVESENAGRPVVPTYERGEGEMWAPASGRSLDPAERQRSVYVKRSFPFPMLAIFDVPDRGMSAP
jgi:hypothetical protein